MPSYAHDQARLIAHNLLDSVLTAEDLVVGELAIVWDPHDLRHHLVPDLMVALGAGELDPAYGFKRLQYRIWDEKGPPDLVVEFASRSTVGRDNLGKKEDYAALGVREYVQFDPLGELLTPRLQVYRLGSGGYQRVIALDDAVPSLVVSGYAWLAVGDLLRLRDESTGLSAPTPEEARAAAEAAQAAAEARARQERAAREAAQARASLAEEEVARLRADLARLRAGQFPPDSAS
jgi:Uma2 family endonuclease